MSSECGPVERAVRNSLSEGEKLQTPSGRGTLFTIDKFDRTEVRLSVGTTGAPIIISWHEFEGVVPYLRELGGEIGIGAVNAVTGQPATLDDYFKSSSTVRRSNYAASILDKAGIVEIVHTTPMQVRLRDR